MSGLNNRRGLKFYRNDGFYKNFKNADNSQQDLTINQNVIYDGEIVLGRYNVYYKYDQISGIYKELDEDPISVQFLPVRRVVTARSLVTGCSYYGDDYIFCEADSKYYLTIQPFVRAGERLDDNNYFSEIDPNSSPYLSSARTIIGACNDYEGNLTGRPKIDIFVDKEEVNRLTNISSQQSFITVQNDYWGKQIDLGYDYTLREKNNCLSVNFHSGTIEAKYSTSSAILLGYGVKHDNTLSETGNGLSVNVDGNTITTVSNGKVKVKIDSTDNFITASSSGIKVNATLLDTTNSESVPLNVFKRYRLKGKNNINIGDPIDIFKDRSLYKVYLGSVDDYLEQMYIWVGANDALETTKQRDTFPSGTVTFEKISDTDTYQSTGRTVTNYDSESDTITVYNGVSSSEYRYLGYNTPFIHKYTTSNRDAAICFVYILEDGSYEIVNIDVESFLEESEFSDGLDVTNHVVTTKLWNGLQFHYIAGSNNAIEVKLGNGLEFDTTATDGVRPIKVKTGGGLDTDNNGVIEINLASYMCNNSGTQLLSDIPNVLNIVNDELTMVNIISCGTY